MNSTKILEMRIFIITQNDPFYLSDNLEYLIKETKKRS